jgi:hypothetical protein
MENIEEKNLGEQPQQNLALNAGEQQNNETEVLSGSLMEKFKTVDALQSAYKNLEKEFTQKCQKIKELSQKISEMDNAEKPSAPEYEQEDWGKKVETFFSNHPEAKEYAVEISNVLSSEEQIAKSENSLENALTKVLAQKFVPYEKLVADEDFLNKYIYQNKAISEKIVDKYLQNLSAEKAMPLMSSASGTGTFSSPVSKPKTITEAGKMAETYFNN